MKGMMTKFFSASAKVGAPGGRVFYDTPPVGYAVLGYPFVGHYLAAEWAGKLFVSLASGTFVIGTEEHKAAAAALPKPTYGAPRSLPSLSDWTQTASGMQCKVYDGRFYKLVAAARRSGPQFAAMHAVYRHPAALTDDDGSCPPAARLALTARAAYGAHEVLVTMDVFAGAVPCIDDDVLMAGRIQTAVVAGLVWLALNRVVYVDVRGPNVLVKRGAGGGDVRLVDFDDAVVSPAPITNYADYLAALRDAENNAAHTFFVRPAGAGTFAGRVQNLADKRMDAIRAALKAAFDGTPGAAAAVSATRCTAP